jgi:hypothetical protein
MSGVQLITHFRFAPTSEPNKVSTTRLQVHEQTEENDDVAESMRQNPTPEHSPSRSIDSISEELSVVAKSRKSSVNTSFGLLYSSQPQFKTRGHQC